MSIMAITNDHLDVAAFEQNFFMLQSAQVGRSFLLILSDFRPATANTQASGFIRFLYRSHGSSAFAAVFAEHCTVRFF
jgi:hypothetical protein